jgi:hypothetical protein
MQIVGRTCSLTGQKIQLDVSGIGCSTCDAVYLRSSISGSECPQCHQGMDALAKESLLYQKQQAETVLSKGHTGFKMVGAIVLAQFIFSVVGSFAGAFVDIGGGMLIITGGLFLWPLSCRGNKFARILLLVSIAFNTLIEGVVAIRALQIKSYLGSGLLLSFAAVNIAALFLLCSRNVNAFLDDQRHSGQD